MSVCGIICEYDPFHNGHLHHIQMARKAGNFEGIVCILSGLFTQRAAPAMLLPHTRAEMALRGGADLVLELPLPWSCASARDFAHGGVGLLESTGTVTHISFGCERLQTDALMAVAGVIVQEGEAYQSVLKGFLSEGCSFPAARERAVRAMRVLDDEALLGEIMNEPNNLLALEYCCALNRFNSAMQPVPIKREGAGHHAAKGDAGFTSATWLRQQIQSGQSSRTMDYIPQAAQDVLDRALQEGCFIQASSWQAYAFAALRNAASGDFKGVYGVSEGLENRLMLAARQSRSLAECIQRTKTKRYTHTHIQRMILCMLLGIRRDLPQPPYLRLIGMRKSAAGILRDIQLNSRIPVLSRAADSRMLDEDAMGVFQMNMHAASLYTLFLHHEEKRGDWLSTAPPVILDI